jgi:single-stranded-DNA-specific exonuclease
VDEGDLAFRLAPRINAAGRLYRADAGVELFLTDDQGRAEEIAEELSRANAERRDTEHRVDGEAEAKRREMPDELKEAPAIVVAGEGWHPGVIGIVASRLAERHNRPAVVIALDGEGGGRGSGRSIPGFDLLAALEACSGHLVRFGGHRAAAGLELRADDLDAFRDAFCAHAAEVLGPDDLVRTERIDAMVGGAGLGLDLAEELQRLAPFGMGNPGVRLLVPAARVKDVRAMGEGKHARFSLHSGSHRALGVAFGRSNLGVAEQEAVDAAVRLEVNRWNGSVEPRVVLRELYPRQGGGGTAACAVESDAPAEWWDRYEAELAADPAGGTKGAQPRADGAIDSESARRERVRSGGSAAALLAELATCTRGGVLAVVADRERRLPLAREGVELADCFRLESDPRLAEGFEHVVLADPPPSGRIASLAELPAAGGGYLHAPWGDAELRLAISVLDDHLARRPALIDLFRALRDLGEAGGEELREALRGDGRRPRAPEAAARCMLVLAELGLVQGGAEGGRGTVGVVSSDGTDLERSTAYRAFGARHQESIRFLERHRQDERRGAAPRRP